MANGIGMLAHGLSCPCTAERFHDHSGLAKRALSENERRRPLPNQSNGILPVLRNAYDYGLALYFGRELGRAHQAQNAFYRR